MRGTRVYLSLGGVAAAILLVSGCGGGSSSVPVTGASGASGASGANGANAVTKAAYIKQADAICAEANSAIEGLNSGAAQSEESFQISQELDITRSELESLQALTPPDEDRSTLNDFLTALKNEVDALTRANSAAAGGGDTATADSELASARSNAEQAATDYGMHDCGNAKSHQAQPSGSTTPAPTTTTPAPAPTTTTTVVPTTPTTPTTPAPAPAPPTGGSAGGAPSGGTGGSSGGTGSGGSGGGSGGVTP